MLSAVGVVVAYEADAIDPVARLGWSVIGVAKRVFDLDDAAGFEDVLRPWVRGSMDHVIRIVPEMVAGFELPTAPEPQADGGSGAHRIKRADRGG